ncbi:hypothetical protein AGMMS49579_02280 [Spirochaetia bacterium]|nr:hypothetical protein AGMMS49579_01990 [Spirochaetia bacterium]GHV49768.1 hypothetical protein AGMMS49579_02280 [Spirochaetia bacterium]
MGFYDAANHWLIYLMVIIGILYVAGLAVVSMRKSWKRALAKGYSREKLMTVVKASVSATIVPSLAIVIGLFSLVALLGIPWPWWRLSVVGAVMYETMAADSAIKAVGLSLGQLSEATAQDFVLVMFVMSIGIMFGICVSPFISKKIQAGTMNLKSGDKRWGALGGSIFILVIIVVFVTPMLLDYSKTGIVRLLTICTSVAITIALGAAAKQEKLSWLKSFILAISMILAMASSVLWTGLLN